ncbi:MAG: nucleotide sugar dehydrogenase [Candidatus Woesearchaeota archaeon]|nr:MAG: nucleotide sugar dehydrogenase [Candidatus Woesearchaeota archaeon]
MILSNLKVGVVGLGYVGLPLAVAFSKKFNTIGYDTNEKKIKLLQQGIDPNNEFSKEELESSKLIVTNDEKLIKQANFIVVAVPTPVDESNRPDLTPLEKSSETIGRNLSKKAIVVYESTVYPGATEEVCLPILEKTSGMKCGIDFKIGYSPERINPGDKEHTLERITKIVSGCDNEALDTIKEVYGSIIKAGLYLAPSIRVAEAAKVIENIQRDLNIALFNELALIFNKMGIKSKDVFDAAATKWNFHRYYPAFVGGHCIPVDPYYMTHKAELLGYHPEVILAGRRINDSMPKHVRSLAIQGINKAKKVLADSRVIILGLTFKENVNDARNSKVVELIKELKRYNINVLGCEPHLSNETVREKFGVENYNISEIKNNIDCVILVNAHNSFKDLTLDELKKHMNKNPVIVDMKNFFNEKEAIEKGFIYSCL